MERWSDESNKLILNYFKIDVLLYFFFNARSVLNDVIRSGRFPRTVFVSF